MGYLKKYFGIGSLDRDVTIIEDVYSRDNDFNTETVEDTNENRVWAAKLNKRGDETHISDKETNKKRVEWIIRYHGIKPTAKMRLIYDGVEYDIKDFEEIGRKRFWKIITERKL